MIRNLSALIFAWLMFSGFAMAQQETARKQPNIIFVLVDDMGYGDVGVFFQNLRRNASNTAIPFLLTPTLDTMAKYGAIFTNQYCNAPVCAPSRASLLTGMNQGNAHIRNNQFDKALEDNYTMANVLKGAGYVTAAIGKWGLQGVQEVAPNWPAHPLNRGFDYFFGYMRHRDGHEHYPYEGIYRGKKEVWKNRTEISSALEKCYTTDLWTAAAKKWIGNQVLSDDKKPFFMYLAYDTPHAVLELPTQAYPQGSGISGGIQWSGKPGEMINTASGVPDSYIHPDYAHAFYDHDKDQQTSLVPWPDTYKRYATSIRRIDESLADLIQLLDDLGVEENTLIVFSSDNGPSIESYLPEGFVPNLPNFFGSYGPFDGIKRDTWEGGLRMPVIAYWPAVIAPNKNISHPSMLSDWLATFAEIAKVPVPARSDGISLLPVLRGESMQQGSTIYVEYFEGKGSTPDFIEFEPQRRNRKRGEMQMIRLDSLVGVRYNIQSSKDDFEIYNVVTDPKQTRNLNGINSRLDTIQDLMKARVLRIHRTDSAARRPYDEALIPALDVPDGNMKAGLNYAFYKGWLPYVSKQLHQAPVKQGIAKTLAESENELQGQWVYQGLLKAPESGIYQFEFSTDGKAIVRLHEILIVDADFGYGSNEKRVYSVHLEKGFHPVKIYLLNQKKSNLTVGFSVTTPDRVQGAPEFFYVN